MGLLPPMTNPNLRKNPALVVPLTLALSPTLTPRPRPKPPVNPNPSLQRLALSPLKTRFRWTSPWRATFLATAAWWLRLGSLGLAEYAAPFLAFDETTLAAVAGFNSVVDVLDVDFANAISNTALSTPSMLL